MLERGERFLRLRDAALAFEAEGHRGENHYQRALRARVGCDERRGAGTRAAAEADDEENQLAAPSMRALDFVDRLLGRCVADFRDRHPRRGRAWWCARAALSSEPRRPVSACTSVFIAIKSAPSTPSSSEAVERVGPRAAEAEDFDARIGVARGAVEGRRSSIMGVALRGLKVDGHLPETEERQSTADAVEKKPRGRCGCMAWAYLMRPIAVENCGFSKAEVTPLTVCACVTCTGIPKTSSAR